VCLDATPEIASRFICRVRSQLQTIQLHHCLFLVKKAPLPGSAADSNLSSSYFSVIDDENRTAKTRSPVGKGVVFMPEPNLSRCEKQYRDCRVGRGDQGSVNGSERFTLCCALVVAVRGSGEGRNECRAKSSKRFDLPESLFAWQPGHHRRGFKGKEGRSRWPSEMAPLS
jgi:hypothetical protein